MVLISLLLAVAWHLLLELPEHLERRCRRLRIGSEPDDHQQFLAGRHEVAGADELGVAAPPILEADCVHCYFQDSPIFIKVRRALEDVFALGEEMEGAIVVHDVLRF